MANGEVADLTVLPEDQRVLSAAFVRRLVRGVERDENGNAVNPQPSGVRIKGLQVAEDLDLSNLDVTYPLELTDGQFDGRVNLQDAGLRSLRLDGCTFQQPVDARNLETRSDFSAIDSTFEDRLCLAGAEIKGDIWLQGVHLRSKTPVDRLAIAGPGFSKRVALDADGIVVGGEGNLNAVAGGRKFEAHGEVRLLGAKIGGTLDCTGSSFHNPKGVALGADAMEVGGSVFLKAQGKETRFEANGEVRLLGAKIGGSLECNGGTFQSLSGVAFIGDGIEVGGNVFLISRDSSTRFEANGEVRLPGAKIAGQLNCGGGWLKNSKGIALNADRIEVGGSVLLNARGMEAWFEANGEVRLLGAIIGGNLECIGGSIQNPDGIALGADNMRVSGSMLVRQNSGYITSCDGDVSLVGATVGSYFQWRDIVSKHGVDLSHASVVTLDLHSIAHPELWQLNGFLYQGLAEPEIAHGSELLTLLEKCDKGAYFPQPYRQLFRCLRDAGHAEEATNVAVEMRRQAFIHERKKLSDLKPRLWLLRSWFSELWEWILWLIGYGYRPWRAVGIAMTLWAVGSAIYTGIALGPFHDFMAPAEGDLLAAVQSNPNHNWREGGPPFVPWLYALDRFMPVVDLGQASFFRPKVSTGHTFLWIDAGWWLNSYDWLLIASGWVLSLLFAGSVSGLMRRIDSDA